MLDREAGEWWLRTREAIFPGMTIAEIFDVREGPLYEQMKRNILHVNGPDHTRLRSLVNPALSARAVERWRPAMRGFLEGLLADACAAGTDKDGVVRCEFVEAFAKPYPSQTIARGDGRADRGCAEAAPLVELDSAPVRRGGRWPLSARGSSSAVEEFYEYAEALVAARREDPREDDLISKLIAAEEAGEKLSDVECINLVFNVLVGGVDTTQSQLAHAIRLLAEHPEQWELLRERSGARPSGGGGGAAV